MHQCIPRSSIINCVLSINSLELCVLSIINSEIRTNCLLTDNTAEIEILA